MGVNVRLSGECCEPVIAELYDSRNAFVHLLGEADVSTSLCLRFIDPYGTTIFNGLQSHVLEEELTTIQSYTKDPDLASYLRQAVDFCGRARNESLFIAFLGD